MEATNVTRHILPGDRPGDAEARRRWSTRSSRAMVQCVSIACGPCAALSVCAIVIGILDEFRWSAFWRAVQ